MLNAKLLNRKLKDSFNSKKHANFWLDITLRSK